MAAAPAAPVFRPAPAAPATTAYMAPIATPGSGMNALNSGAAAPASKPFNQAQHQNDYENWRMAYLHAKAEQSEALSNSPLWNAWNMVNPDENSPLNQATKDKMFDNFSMQTWQKKMEAANYAVSVSAARGASDDVLDDLKKEYEFARLNAVNQQLNNPMIQYQIARQWHQWDAGFAEYVAAIAETPDEKRDAQLVMQMANMDFLDSVSPLLGDVGSMSVGANMNSIVRIGGRSAILRGIQRQFNEQKAAYQANPTAEEFYKLQVAELQLEKHESKYMRELSAFVKPLENLMGGNYFQSLRFKEESIDAKIADLAEKLAREQYKINQDREPYGSTNNEPTMEKQQRMFYNMGMGR